MKKFSSIFGQILKLFPRVEVWDAEHESEVILTNHLAFGSTTTAAIYKDRWQVEIFFKTLKQNPMSRRHFRMSSSNSP